jgi:FdhE protein
MLAALEREHPEWRAWVALLQRARQAATRSAWRDCRIERADDRPPEAPLLTGGLVAVDGGAADRLVRDLLAVAAGSGQQAASLRHAARAGDLQPLPLLEAAVCDDVARLATAAAALQVDAAPLRSVAQVVAIAVLQAWAPGLGDRVPADWARGYCPLCGAWPALAEERGLERTRRLRCARCGLAWWTSCLRCPFCGTTDHARLGSLRSASATETQRVETCDACQRYLKTVVVLAPIAPQDVAVVDLATVPLDLAAVAHGYGRPAAPGYPLGLRVGLRPGLVRRLLVRS